MKCLSCEFDVDLKWKYAVDNNVCPSCGNKIMSDELKNNLSLLREVMDNLKSELPSLENWLFDTYGLLLNKSDLFVSLMPKQKSQLAYVSENAPPEKQTQPAQAEDVEEVEEQMSDDAFTTLNKGDQNTVNQYFKNAEVSDTVKRQKDIKGMISQIKSSISSPTSFSTFEQEGLDSEDYDGEDYDDYEDEDADIPPALLARAGGISQSAKDMALLKKMQSKSKSAASRMRSGGGGFSR